jgi:hypothetical protein
MERELAHASELFQIDIDSQIEPALINATLFRAAGRIGKDLADIGRGKLDAPSLQGIRQQTQPRLLDRALAGVRIGRLQVVGLLVLLRRGGAGSPTQDQEQR